MAASSCLSTPRGDSNPLGRHAPLRRMPGGAPQGAEPSSVAAGNAASPPGGTRIWQRSSAMAASSCLSWDKGEYPFRPKGVLHEEGNLPVSHRNKRFPPAVYLVFRGTISTCLHS